jgi:GT2 family glycosyltransferase
MNYGHSSSLLKSKKNVRNQIGDKNTNIFLKKGKEKRIFVSNNTLRKKRMQIYVIIVSYNFMHWIDNCLGSLRLSSVPVCPIVIDNGSTDGTQAYLQSNYPEAIFIQNSENAGFGKANNIGIKYALKKEFDFLYLLNQDAWIYPDTISLLINTHKEHPEYGILSPMQMNKGGLIFDKNFCQRSLGRDAISDFFKGTKKNIYDTDSVMAAHWLIASDCIKKVGGFSPAFPHYGEDDNYQDRARFFGFKVGIVPNSIAIHDRGDRKDDILKRAYIVYIHIIVNYCNINKKQKSSFIKTFLYAIPTIGKYVILAKSFTPIKYLVMLLRKRKSIKNAMMRSKDEGAFL